MTEPQDPTAGVAAAGGLIPDVETSLTPTQKKEIGDAVKTMQRRENGGYVLGIVGIIGAVGLAIYSFCSLHQMAERFTDSEKVTEAAKAPPAPESAGEGRIKLPEPSKEPSHETAPPKKEISASLQVFYVSVVGHTVITIALIWLLYQLLRAGERMVLPRSLATDSEMARTLLGISSPHREVQKMLGQLIGAAAKGKPAAEE